MISTAKIPLKESASRIVYLVPFKNTTFCIARVFLSEYPYCLDKVLSFFELSSKNIN